MVFEGQTQTGKECKERPDLLLREGLSEAFLCAFCVLPSLVASTWSVCPLETDLQLYSFFLYPRVSWMNLWVVSNKHTLNKNLCLSQQAGTLSWSLKKWWGMFSNRSRGAFLFLSLSLSLSPKGLCPPSNPKILPPSTEKQACQHQDGGSTSSCLGRAAISLS